MKTKLLLLLISFSVLSIGLGVYNAKENMAEWEQFEEDFKKKTFQLSQKTSFFAPSLRKKTQTKKRPEEQQVTQAVQQLDNLEGDELDLVLESKDKAKLSLSTAQVIRELSACLKNQECSNNQKNTDTVELLKRSLNTAIILSEDRPELAQNFDSTTVQAALELDNPDIQTLGIELITSSPELSEERFNELLNKASHLHIESRAVLFSQAEKFTRGNENKRKRYLSELQNELNKDAENAVEILKYLQFVKLSKQELVQVSQGLCQYKSSQRSQSWEAIEYHHRLHQSAKGNDLSLNKICQN